MLEDHAFEQRYYDPQLGLFLSVDPVTAYSSPVTQFHRYRYANNNPYKFVDPDGEKDKVAWLVELGTNQMRKLARLTQEQAVRPRRAEQNVVADRRQTASQIETAAHGRDGQLKHAGHAFTVMTQALDPSSALSMPLSEARPVSSSLETVSPDGVRFTRGPRSYRVRGLARCLSAEALKVTLRLSCGDRLHLDTLDLYQARQRAAFVKAAALEIGVAESVIAGDLAALVIALEPLQEQANGRWRGWRSTSARRGRR